MTKALVTGANGFIGSHLVRELVRRGYEVNALVRHTSDVTSLARVPMSLFIGDVRDPETLELPMIGVDYVFHLAAELMVTSREAFEEANAQGTVHVLEAAERHAADTLKRFLLVSSQAAAGPGEDPAPYDEQREPRPISWYGTSKLHAEQAALGRADRLPVTIVRPSVVYGEREREISQSYAPISQRLQPVMGVMPKHTVMVYVGDLVKAIVDAAESEAARGEIYFLSHPQALTVKDAVKTIAQAMDKPQGIRFPIPIPLMRLAAPVAEAARSFTRRRPPITRDKVRELSQRFWVADPSKAKRDFGWEAEHDLEQGMRVTVTDFANKEAELRRMPLEGRFSLWLKYLVVAVLLGTLIEISSALGGFYTFTPRWLVLGVVLGAFGLMLGTLAMWLRMQRGLVQFLIGTVLVSVAEVVNTVGVLPSVGWQFAPAWPFGITNQWVRSFVLGLAGGIFLLLVNAAMRSLYKRRLRLG